MRKQMDMCLHVARTRSAYDLLTTEYGKAIELRREACTRHCHACTLPGTHVLARVARRQERLVA
jgi:hypothetical protein